MSPVKKAFYIDVACPWCQQDFTVEQTIGKMDDETIEMIREHIEENSEQYASMAVPDDPQPHCSYPTDSGPCSREVDHEDDTCWQHGEEE